MKKIILVIFTILLATAMLMTLVFAQSPHTSSDKTQSIEWFLAGIHSEYVEGYPKLLGNQETVIEKTIRTLTGSTIFPSYLQIDENTRIMIAPLTGYEGYLTGKDTISKFEPTWHNVTYRIYEKIMWNNNYLEITSTERGIYTDNPRSYRAYGTFSGQGIIDGQRIHVMGTRMEYMSIPGPGLTVSCTGTIRF